MLKNVNVGALNAENCFGELVEVLRTDFGTKNGIQGTILLGILRE